MKPPLYDELSGQYPFDVLVGNAPVKGFLIPQLTFVEEFAKRYHEGKTTSADQQRLELANYFQLGAVLPDVPQPEEVISNGVSPTDGINTFLGYAAVDFVDKNGCFPVTTGTTVAFQYPKLPNLTGRGNSDLDRQKGTIVLTEPVGHEIWGERRLAFSGVFGRLSITATFIRPATPEFNETTGIIFNPGEEPTENTGTIFYEPDVGRGSVVDTDGSIDASRIVAGIIASTHFVDSSPTSPDE